MLVKPRKKPKASDPRQYDFFGQIANTIHEAMGTPAMALPGIPDQEVIPGRYDNDQLVRRLINGLIRASGVDRDIIAERMTKLVGHRVTKCMVDSWTGSGRPNHFPLCYLAGLMRACDAGGDAEHEFLTPQLADTGWAVVDAARAKLIVLGQLAGAIFAAASQAMALVATGRAGVRLP